MPLTMDIAHHYRCVHWDRGLKANITLHLIYHLRTSNPTWWDQLMDFRHPQNWSWWPQVCPRQTPLAKFLWGFCILKDQTFYVFFQNPSLLGTVFSIHAIFSYNTNMWLMLSASQQKNLSSAPWFFFQKLPQCPPGFHLRRTRFPPG